MASQDLIDSVNSELQYGVQAAELVAGGEFVLRPDDYVGSQALLAAEAVLRRVGDFRRLESLCRRLLDSDAATEDPTAAESVWRCIGDSLVLQGRPEDAVDTYADAAEALEPVTSLGANILLPWGAARLAVEPGDEEGRQLLQRGAQDYDAAARARVCCGWESTISTVAHPRSQSPTTIWPSPHSTPNTPRP